MWCHVGCHTHRNACRPIDKQIWHTGRQHRRHCLRAVIVILPIYRIFVKVGKHLVRELLHTHLGITHGSGWVAIYRTKVSLPIYQHITHRKRLSKTYNGIIHRSIAMRMIFTDNITHNTGGFFVRFVIIIRQLVHGIHHTAMNGL